MLKLIVTVSLFMSVAAFSVTAQEIKKISISELDSLIKYSQTPLIINFWATFCKPCIEEIPHFEKTLQQYKHANIQLLLVSLDLPDYYPLKIKSFIQTKKITARVLWLNETNADFFCPYIDKKWSGAIPATLMINNLKNKRKFYDKQLTPLQVDTAIKQLLE